MIAVGEFDWIGPATPSTVVDDQLSEHTIPVVRRAAYALIIRRRLFGEQVLCMKAPNGQHYLPGGALERNETHADALCNEVFEETGLRVVSLSCVGWIDESSLDVRNVSSGWVVRTIGSPRPKEPGYKIRWLAPMEAVRRLKRPSHKNYVLKWYNKAPIAARAR